MKALILMAGLSLAVPTLAWPQETEHQYRAEAYAFAAYEATLGAAGGGGGEVFLNKGFALGGEFVKAENPIGEYNGAFNMYYHFGASTDKRKVEPFVTGGYTWLYVPNVDLPHADGGNIGAGLNIWAFKHAALRLELRDTIGGRDISIIYESGGNYYAAPNNVVSFRIGVAFR